MSCWRRRVVRGFPLPPGTAPPWCPGWRFGFLFTYILIFTYYIHLYSATVSPEHMWMVHHDQATRCQYRALKTPAPFPPGCLSQRCVYLLDSYPNCNKPRPLFLLLKIKKNNLKMSTLLTFS